MTAIVKLVYDGGAVAIPPEMGAPAPGQMEGTELERLAELAGRVCYDSLGSGRSSEGFHQHIIEVNHGSIWEHANITIEFKVLIGDDYKLGEFMSRPGVYLRNMGYRQNKRTVRLTTNIRALREYKQWSRWLNPATTHSFWPAINHACANAGLSPRLLNDLTLPTACSPRDLKDFDAKFVEPADDFEQWISLYIGNVSRGLSHELVRHGDFTAISQRSTRYCDESKSNWIEHPAITAYNKNGEWGGPTNIVRLGDGEDGEAAEESTIEKCARDCYDSTVLGLERFLKSKNIDSFTARKQARGAARGYLGNALSTELIFSANVWAWNNIIKQRGSPAADAEIRAMACAALRVLQSSRYGNRFGHWTIEKSPDSIGEIIV